MMRELKHLFRLTLAATVLSLLSACVYDEAPQGASPSDNVQLTFTIVSSGTPKNLTRATWGEIDKGNNADHGNLYETRIDPDRLQILVYAENGTFVGELSNLEYSRMDYDGQKYIYKYKGQLDNAEPVIDDKGYLNAKFLVLANCKEKYTPSESATKFGDLQSDSYFKLEYTPADYYTDTPKADGSTPAQAIPMSGWKTVTDTFLKKGWTTDIGDIYVLRSLAKVRLSIEADATPKGLKIFGVTLNQYNPKINLLPKGYNLGGDTETLDIDYDTTSNPADANLAQSPIPFTKEVDKDGKETGAWIIYIPEFNNDKGLTTMTVTAGTSKGSAKEYEMKLNEYEEDGTPDDAKPVSPLRNTVYGYSIKQIKGSNLTIEIKDWVPGGTYDVEE